MLGVIGALDEEVTHLKSGMVIHEEKVHAGMTVFSGSYGSNRVPIVLVKCGVGKVNAAICTQLLIDLYHPSSLVFSGVAGGLLPNMKVGDVVIASHLIQFDVDLTAFGRRHGELPGEEQRFFESDPAMVQSAANAFDEAYPKGTKQPNLMIGTVASGDRFIKDEKKLKWLQREFSAFATEMEGAAFAHCAKLNCVPFLVVRGISDTADENASDHFLENLHTVSKNTFPFLEKMIAVLGSKS